MTKEHKTGKTDAGVGLSGLLQSLGGFLDLVSNLADKEGQEFHRSGELGDEAKGHKAVYGVSVRLGGGGKPRIEPFGNVIKKGTRGPVVDDVREPLVDVFDEDGHLLVVAELPGVEERDIGYELAGERLTLTARRSSFKYAKELLLPAPVTAEGAQGAYRNGVYELKLRKAGG